MNKSPKSRILIVEDQKSFRDAAEAELMSMGFETSTAEDGERGLKKVLSESFDLIISDIRMPGWDGGKLLTELRKKNPQLPPFLFMSGFSDFSLEEAYDMGADGIIAKPFSSQVLEQSIRNVLLPVATRWSSTQSPSPKKITGHLSAVGDLGANPCISLGRGGFYVQGFNELDSIPLGSYVDYGFSFLAGDVRRLEGTGILAWRRLKYDASPQVEAGLSITSLSPSCRDNVIAYIVNHKIVPFIPNHHSE